MLLISKTSMLLKVSRLYELHKDMERRKDWIGTVMAKVSSQSINDNFCNTCWWTQVQKGTSWVPKEKWKSVEPKKSSILIMILICAQFKAIYLKLLDGFIGFPYTLPKVLYTTRFLHWKSHWKFLWHWKSTETTLKNSYKGNHSDNPGLSYWNIFHCCSRTLKSHWKNLNHTEKFSALLISFVPRFFSVTLDFQCDFQCHNFIVLKHIKSKINSKILRSHF